MEIYVYKIQILNSWYICAKIYIRHYNNLGLYYRQSTVLEYVQLSVQISCRPTPVKLLFFQRSVCQVSNDAKLDCRTYVFFYFIVQIYRYVANLTITEFVVVENLELKIRGRGSLDGQWSQSSMNMQTLQQHRSSAV